MRSTTLTAILVLGFATPALAGDSEDKSFQEITYQSGKDKLTIEPNGKLTGVHDGKTFTGQATPAEWAKLEEGPLSDKDNKAIEKYYDETTVINLGEGPHPYEIEVKKSFFHRYHYKGPDTVMDDASGLIADVAIAMLDRMTGGAILHGTTITGTVQYGDFDEFQPAVSIKDDAGNVYFLVDGMYGGETLNPEEMGLKVGERIQVYGTTDWREVDSQIGTPHKVTTFNQWYPPTILPASADAPTPGMSAVVQGTVTDGASATPPGAPSAPAATTPDAGPPREARKPVPALDRPLGD